MTTPPTGKITTEAVALFWTRYATKRDEEGFVNAALRLAVEYAIEATRRQVAEEIREHAATFCMDVCVYRRTERAGVTTPPESFKTGDKVSKTGGDYRFDGTVVAVFTKLSGVTRYVVEDDRGVLHVYSAKNLEAA